MSPTRPRFDPSYGISNKPEGLLDWSEVATAFEKSRNYWIVSTRPDGRPHAAPVWGLWLDETVMFSTSPNSVKGRNVAVNPNVVVHLESGDDVYMLEGVVERVTKSEVLARFVDAYDAKYGWRVNPDDPNGLFYVVRARKAYAWHEKNFPESATAWTL
jgi:hypothetical protein